MALPPDGDPIDPHALPRTIAQQITSAIYEIEFRNDTELGLIKLYRLLRHLEDPEISMKEIYMSLPNHWLRIHNGDD